MMQVLNLARDEYTLGKSLYEDGRKAEAEKYFRSAEQKVEYIKEPFPNNHAAGVLYLQILQFTEPEDFESIFRGRFHAAMGNLSSSPEESYRELQVLREIKPDYPGLDDALYRAEIATGIRQPPPDPSKLARARELYRQAEDIFQRDVRAQFPIALAYLNEAINLDPDYREAIVLKDRIQTGQGGQVTVVLSSVDQQKLNQAENFFIAGRYFEASALVEQLWQNPGNRSNPKLVELRRRIQSQL
jgi:tetratricopeptide (TPR) repeat protein